MNATKNIANYLYSTGTRATFYASTLVVTAFLTGCALPTAPPRAVVYDFGPGAVMAQPTTRLAPLPTLALAEVESSAALDSTAVLYRLAYTDTGVLRPYAQARWSMSPAQLVRQRVREHLSLRRAVLNPGESASAATTPATLRLELEEFSHLFESTTASTGLVRLRATVLQGGGTGEKLVGQKTFIVQSPAPSADAAGGARALTAATDAAVLELDQWLQQLR